MSQHEQIGQNDQHEFSIHVDNWCLEGTDKSGAMFVSYQTNRGHVSLVHLGRGMQVTLSFDPLHVVVSQVRQVAEGTLLIAAFDARQVPVLENLAAEDVRHYLLRCPLDWRGLATPADVMAAFRLQAVDGDLLGFGGDSLLAQGQLKNFGQTQSSGPASNQVIFPTVYNHFVTMPDGKYLFNNVFHKPCLTLTFTPHQTGIFLEILFKISIKF